MKFALFGHGFHLCYLTKLLIDNGFEKPVIITHPGQFHTSTIDLETAKSKTTRISNVF